MRTVSIDVTNERVALSLSSEEAGTLAAVFDAASRLPNGMVADGGWLDTSEGLARAAALVRERQEGTTEDGETQIRAHGRKVILAFGDDLASDLASEIERAIPLLLPEDWRAVAAQIRESATELASSLD